MSLERRIQIGGAVAVVIILAVGAAALRSTAATVESARWVAHTLEVRAELEATFAELIYAETAVRGYVITGDTTYLAPYDSAQARLGGLLTGLRALTSDNPAQLTRLDSLATLVSVRLERFHWTVATRRTGGPAAAAPVVSWNAGAQRIRGYKAEEIIGQHFSRFYTPEDVAAGKPQHSLGAAAEGRYEEENWRIRKDGSRFWADVVITAVRDDRGTLLGFAKVTRDLTERQRAEEALRASEDRFRTLAVTANDAIISADSHGNITYFNPAAERIFGYGATEVNGKPLTVLMPERFRDAHHAGIARYLATGEARVVGKTVELAGQKKNGAEFPLELSLASWQRGSEIAFTAIIRDVTERKRVDETLRRHTAQVEAANAELEAFAYSVSHDLRAPLRGIDGFSQAVLDEYSEQLDDVGRDYLVRLRASSQRMGALIDDMLSLSRVSRVELSRVPVDLTAIAKSIAAELQEREPGREVEFVIEDEVTVQGDPRFLGIVLQNLLANAFKFTSGNATARIEF